MKFSVTIPAYKITFLRECIDSILSQTYKDFELIIVNDASPEDIDSIVSQYEDPRIRYYVNKKNCGAIDVVDNWNICLSYAKGDYIICLGDDDKLLPNCLEEYNRLIFEFPNKGVYHAFTEIINDRSEVISMQEGRPREESVYSLIWQRWNNNRIQFIGDFLFDRKLLVDNGGFYKLPLAWGSDDISVIIAASKSGIVNSQVPLFQYRENEKTITSTGNTKIKIESIILEKGWFVEFLKISPNNIRDNIYRRCIINYIDIFFKKKILQTIASDISSKTYFKIFYWLYFRRKYRLSTKEIIYAFITAYKIRNKR